MSKIGKKPIKIPESVEVKIKDGVLEFLTKSGASANLKLLPYIKAEIKDSELIFNKITDIQQARANWGTMRALANNVICGLVKDFVKFLEIEGIGFRAAMEGNTLVLNVGFTHPIKFISPPGIKISTEKNLIKISGADKMLVGEIAAKIRKAKKPEPYKGKGIRYQGEIIKRKDGKKTVGATGGGAA